MIIIKKKLGFHNIAEHRLRTTGVKSLRKSDRREFVSTSEKARILSFSST